MIMTILWPSSPAEASWESDCPNEGLLFDEDFISTQEADYHGYLILTRDSSLRYITLDLPPTRNQQYLAAYKVLLEEFSICWDLTERRLIWERICKKVIERLKLELGWFEVWPSEDHPPAFWTKNAPPEAEIAGKPEVSDEEDPPSEDLGYDYARYQL